MKNYIINGSEVSGLSVAIHIKILKPMYVNNLGAFVGRTVPVTGWVLLANDFSQITYKTVVTYNRIARVDDKVW